MCLRNEHLSKCSLLVDSVVGVEHATFQVVERLKDLLDDQTNPFALLLNKILTLTLGPGNALEEDDNSSVSSPVSSTGSSYGSDSSAYWADKDLDPNWDVDDFELADDFEEPPPTIELNRDLAMGHILGNTD
ncbi:hypothetical protein HDV00_011563 [Rhizophlyctis rosea]|nr:hypothetical protein HDV00_011563 [Rhizophlyctis rosea]